MKKFKSFQELKEELKELNYQSLDDLNSQRQKQEGRQDKLEGRPAC